MNAKARQELIGIAALLVGLFLGLTLLQLSVTGSWGKTIGGLLWKAFGVGSALLPPLGIVWVLAAFERLGPLSSARVAALGAGLTLLVPYGIAIGIGPAFPYDYGQWSRPQQLVGLLPAFLAHGIEGAVGTAGGVLVGLFALSALGIVTVGWHPLTMLRQRGSRLGSRGSGSGLGTRSPRARPDRRRRRSPLRSLSATSRGSPPRPPSPEPPGPPVRCSPPSSC